MSVPSWDLSIAYQNLNDPKIQQDIERVEKKIQTLTQLQSSNIAHLQQALVVLEQANIALRTVATYSNCIAAVDATNSQAKALAGQMDKLNSELVQAFSPLEDSLIRIDDQKLDQVLAGNTETGTLEAFRFHLQHQRTIRDTRLSVPEEQLLAAMTVDGRNAWGRLYDDLTGSLSVTLTLSDGSEETMGLSQAASILYGPDSVRREPAWKAISRVMKTHQQSIGAILNALAGWRLTEYSKRSLKRQVHFLETSLHESRIEEQTLDSLISVARSNQNVGRKAGLLMARLFGTDKLKPWDELASMPAAPGEASASYDFDEAITIIRDAFNRIAPEMGAFVDLMVNNGWIDAAPQPNKRLGAFCTKLANSRTPLVFMTWGGSMSDVLTLAHELGHAFHNWLMRDMPFVQTSYPMTLAETASIFAENVVRDALMEQAKTDFDRKLMLWEEASSALALLINIPVRFEFEKAFYEQRQQGELTPKQLSALMAETWSNWYGEAMDETNEMFWASKLHFSIAEVSFYNYPYLFGYLFSKGVYAQKEKKGASFYNDYKALLRETGSMTAEALVQKHLAMDLRKPAFWQQSLDMVKAQVDAFEALLDKEDS